MTDIRPAVRPISALGALHPLRTKPLPQSQTQRVLHVVRAQPTSLGGNRARSPEADNAMPPSKIQQQVRAFLEAQAQKRAAETKAQSDAQARAKAEAFRKALLAPPG